MHSNCDFCETTYAGAGRKGVVDAISTCDF